MHSASVDAVHWTGPGNGLSVQIIHLRLLPNVQERCRFGSLGEGCRDMVSCCKHQNMVTVSGFRGGLLFREQGRFRVCVCTCLARLVPGGMAADVVSQQAVWCMVSRLLT